METLGRVQDLQVQKYHLHEIKIKMINNVILM